MTSLLHTYESKCRLAPITELPLTRDGESYPQIAAQFFYSSVIPIDDPLAPGTIAGALDPKSVKGRLRPFSREDNNALEKAWLSLLSETDRADHREARKQPGLDLSTIRRTAKRRTRLVRTIANKHFKKHGYDHRPQDVALPVDIEVAAVATTMPACCLDIFVDVDEGLRDSFCALLRKGDHRLSNESVSQDIMMELHRLRANPHELSHPCQKSNSESPARSIGEVKRVALPFVGIKEDAVKALVSSSRINSSSRNSEKGSRQDATSSVQLPPHPPGIDDGISGKPFVRVGSSDTPVISVPSSAPQYDLSLPSTPKEDHSQSPELRSKSNEVQARRSPKVNDQGAQEVQQAEEFEEDSRTTLEITVGVSRLHMVSLPLLLMKPIYWSPVNDVAAVMRATWFYR